MASPDDDLKAPSNVLAAGQSCRIATGDELAIHTGNEPHISFNRSVIDSETGQILRVAAAEFYFEGRSLSGQRRSTWDLKMQRNGHEYVLKFAYSAASVSGVDNVLEEWPTEVQTAIEELGQMRDDCTSQVISLPLQDPTYVKSIKAQLNSQRGNKEMKLLRYWRYKNCIPITNWEVMTQAQYQTHGIPQSLVKYCFPSLQVAAIKLCTGRYMEHKWQENLMASISGKAKVAFVVIGVGLVLAFVRYEDRKQIAKSADRMNIKIWMQVEERRPDGEAETKVIRSVGKLVSNRLGLKSDFSVLLKKPNKFVFQQASSYGTEPRFKSARINIIEDERMAKLEVNAVHELCQEADNPHASFQKMLLGEDAARAPPKNFLIEDMGCSSSEVNTVIESVIRKLEIIGKAPNKEQIQILRNAGVTVAGFKVLLGPPGTGKTTTIAAMTEIYTSCPDTGVLLCAPQMGT